VVARRLLVIVAAGAVSVVPTALADGDPASDVLYTADVFVPYAKPQASIVAGLQKAIDSANARRYRIKVALIQSKNDLGLVQSLDRQPQRYADFLGAEIRFFYHGHLLVVMPNGFGVFADARPVEAPRRLLRSVEIEGRDSNSLARAATQAVRLLAAKDKSLPKYRDRYAPTATAFPAAVKAGQTGQLKFAVYDDSLRATSFLEVYAPEGALVETIHPPSRPADGRPQSVSWNVPDSFAGKSARFCVGAKDFARNASIPSCASIAVE
jgi:hypothetical protein